MNQVETNADREVRTCLERHQSFALVAGAGSGKTASLIDALHFLRKAHGLSLRQNGQRVACITYTNRAVEVMRSRVRFDELFVISTLHSFMWSGIRRFQPDIREVLRTVRIPVLIEKAREKDNRGNSQEARRARERALELEAQLADIDAPQEFRYTDAVYSDYREGQLGHDDVIAIATHLLKSNEIFREILGWRFPYIFVDEAQDTFSSAIEGLNLLPSERGATLIGYFGDPWQQIYDDRAGAFRAPPGGREITKTENFRCSKSVIRFLNAFRTDVKQYAAGENRGREGSVRICLVRAEQPALPRKRYSEMQIKRTLNQMDQVLADWDWERMDDETRLFLARQMIARRLGFSALNALFTGEFASTRAQEQYESGDHFLLRPLLSAIWPLIIAHQRHSERSVIDLLRTVSPDFALDGPNRDRPLRQMVTEANQALDGLLRHWADGRVRDVLTYCRDRRLCRLSERLREALDRAPRTEEYDDGLHAADKGDWLCDAFLGMGTTEIGPYCDFVNNNTAFSTQHGVKGEQHKNVLVVFDDTEAAWSNYSFTKVLTPATSGQPTPGQLERTRKLAYVCFSRALDNLRILLFTTNPEGAKSELLDRGLFELGQVEIRN